VSSAHPATITRTALADTSVASSSNATNFGSSANLLYSEYPSRTSILFVKFDLTGIDVANITAATFRMAYGSANDGCAAGW